MAKKRVTPVITDFDDIPKEALIPEEEQPYEIPEDWKWVKLGSAVRTSGDKTETFDGSEKYVGLEHLAKGGGITGFGDSSSLKSTKLIFKPGQLLYGKLRPYLDKHAIADFHGVCSTDILVYEETPLVDMRWFETWISSNLFIDQANAGTKGINLPRVSDKYLAATPFPLPPIDEQKSIVEKLQATNQKIDDVLERLDQFLDQAPQQRAAIIHAGGTGKLTKKWREDHGVSDETWKESTLGAIADWGGGGTPKKSNPAYWNGSIRWISPKDMKGDRIVDTLDHIGKLAIDESAAKLYDSPSICVVTRSGILRRTLPISMVNGQFTVNQDIKVAHNFRSEPERDFVFRFIQANSETIRTSCMKSGTTVESIEYSKLLRVSINLPSPEEQEQINKAIEVALTVIERAVEAGQAAKTQLELSKRVVRTRTLRGLA